MGLSVGDIVFLVCAGASFIVLERLLPLHPGQKHLRSGWRVDLLHVFLSGTVIRIGVAMATLAMSVAAVSIAPAAIRDAVRSQPDWLEFIEVLLVSDLFFYLAHRLCHHVPLLWRFHAVHHSSETMDWLATYRVHPVDQIFNSTMIALPAVAIGFSPEPLLLYGLIYRVHAPLLHSNVGVGLGWLGRIITTPRFHHWHHADQVEAYDQNFGGQLAFFDRLFGTHNKSSDKALPDRYGMGGAVPETYVGQILQPFGLDIGSPMQAPAPASASSTGN
jgi:sterol desaturase/sphingolipid hydroxylase (fatty acid hydroxylase superfamily)